jgi:hypothetical protein
VVTEANGDHRELVSKYCSFKTPAAPDTQLLCHACPGSALVSSPHQELAYLDGLRSLTLSMIALRREPAGMDRDQPAEQQNNRSKRRDTPWMASNKLGGPILKRIRPRADRLVAENAPEVVCQCDNR